MNFVGKCVHCNLLARRINSFIRLQVFGIFSCTVSGPDGGRFLSHKVR